jgi:hypothetical protein
MPKLGPEVLLITNIWSENPIPPTPPHEWHKNVTVDAVSQENMIVADKTGAFMNTA